jgi:acyl-CoA thioester hydrolase
MNRVDIRLPAEFTFAVGVPLRIGDVNRGGHVGHIAVLSIIEEARAQFWSRCGEPEQHASRGDFGFIIADLAVNYVRQIAYGSELGIEIAAGDFSSKGYAIYYRVVDCTSGIEIARAKTGIVVFDYRQQKPVEVPPDLKDRLTRNYLK